ncbi:outer membrane beta-barrel protein [Hanstruepera flava]|uniref:outer membrane beta-barrel protein n=1 Tax=Hanstruepera flava TaxID=2930218 RepID=UPI00202989F6|nr:outer membrane beta-barrel protein [Hanstruepera flava]
MKLIKIALMLCVTSMSAQSNFVTGSVTTKNNQILNGEIDYQDWKKTPETINFRQGEDIRTFKPEDLLAFQVENDKFISRSVTVDVTEQQLSKMTDTQKVMFEDRHVFLNVLAQGNANLYEYYDSRTHFYAEKGDTFIELINRKKLQEGNQDLMTFKKYLGQLNVLFNDCSSLKISEGLEYRRLPLSKIFNKYNTCISGDDSDNYTKKVEREKVVFYVTAGFAFSNFNFEHPNSILENFDGGSFTTPSFGAAADIPISKNRNKWSLRTELLYSAYKGEFEPNELTTITDGTMYLEQSTLGANVLIRYKFKSKNEDLFPFINGGFGFNYVLSYENYVSYKRVNAISDEEQMFDIGSADSYFTFSVGAGVIYKRFSFEGRFMISDKVLGSVYGSSAITNIGMFVSYQLF